MKADLCFAFHLLFFISKVFLFLNTQSR